MFIDKIERKQLIPPPTNSRALVDFEYADLAIFFIAKIPRIDTVVEVAINVKKIKLLGTNLFNMLMINIFSAILIKRNKIYN